MEPVNEFKIQEPSGDDIEIDEEIEDNQPYISD